MPIVTVGIVEVMAALEEIVFEVEFEYIISKLGMFMSIALTWKNEHRSRKSRNILFSDPREC